MRTLAHGCAWVYDSEAKARARHPLSAMTCPASYSMAASIPSYKLLSRAPGGATIERGWAEGEGAAASWAAGMKIAEPGAAHFYRAWVRSSF